MFKSSITENSGTNIIESHWNRESRMEKLQRNNFEYKMTVFKERALLRFAPQSFKILPNFN